MSLLVIQPLLIGGILPGFSASQRQWLHRIVGGLLVIAILVHVFGLWITSPPDVVDALLFRSPTPFSAWGVIAMLAVFGAAALAVLRRRLHIKPAVWRLGHTGLVTLAVAGSVVHAVLIDGTMEPISKIALCGVVLGATLGVVMKRRAWKALRRVR